MRQTALSPSLAGRRGRYSWGQVPLYMRWWGWWCLEARAISDDVFSPLYQIFSLGIPASPGRIGRYMKIQGLPRILRLPGHDISGQVPQRLVVDVGTKSAPEVPLRWSNRGGLPRSWPIVFHCFPPEKRMGGSLGVAGKRRKPRLGMISKGTAHHAASHKSYGSAVSRAITLWCWRNFCAYNFWSSHLVNSLEELCLTVHGLRKKNNC